MPPSLLLPPPSLLCVQPVMSSNRARDLQRELCLDSCCEATQISPLRHLLSPPTNAMHMPLLTMLGFLLAQLAHINL